MPGPRAEMPLLTGLVVGVHRFFRAAPLIRRFNASIFKHSWFSMGPQINEATPRVNEDKYQGSFAFGLCDYPSEIRPAALFRNQLLSRPLIPPVS